MSGPIAVLGGPGTFAWRAYQQIRESYGWVGEPRYLTEVDEMWAALREGQVEALCLAVETSRSGFTPTASVLLAEPAFHVIAESIIPYRCGLYVRKGSPLQRVQVVLGHRSLDLV
jgi:prephenate dehydratase